MTRRKREIVGLRNERDFPHLVELALPLGPFRSVFLEIDAFHRERRIPVRRGRSRHEAEQSYIRFCFPDTTTADAFRNRFGGECFTHAAVKREAEEDWGQREVAVTGEYAMVYWAKRSCDPDAEIPFMKLVDDLQLKLGAPHELMMLGSHPLTRKGYEVFIGVPQRELLDLFDGFTEIQENELPDKLVALVIREDGFDERFPAIAAKRAAAAKP